MSEEKDFFKTCFDTVAGLEVKNESQAIAKEVVLDEIENLQKENNQLKDRINKLNTNWKEFEKYLDNNKLVLNNSNILQFYLIQKDLLKGDKE